MMTTTMKVSIWFYLVLNTGLVQSGRYGSGYGGIGQVDNTYSQTRTSRYIDDTSKNLNKDEIKKEQDSKYNIQEEYNNAGLKGSVDLGLQKDTQGEENDNISISFDEGSTPQIGNGEIQTKDTNENKRDFKINLSADISGSQIDDLVEKTFDKIGKLSSSVNFGSTSGVPSEIESHVGRHGLQSNFGTSGSNFGNDGDIALPSSGRQSSNIHFSNDGILGAKINAEVAHHLIDPDGDRIDNKHLKHHATFTSVGDFNDEYNVDDHTSTTLRKEEVLTSHIGRNEKTHNIGRHVGDSIDFQVQGTDSGNFGRKGFKISTSQGINSFRKDDATHGISNGDASIAFGTSTRQFNDASLPGFDFINGADDNRKDIIINGYDRSTLRKDLTINSDRKLQDALQDFSGQNTKIDAGSLSSEWKTQTAGIQGDIIDDFTGQKISREFIDIPSTLRKQTTISTESFPSSSQNTKFNYADHDSSKEIKFDVRDVSSRSKISGTDLGIGYGTERGGNPTYSSDSQSGNDHDYIIDSDESENHHNLGNRDFFARREEFTIKSNAGRNSGIHQDHVHKDIPTIVNREQVISDDYTSGSQPHNDRSFDSYVGLGYSFDSDKIKDPRPNVRIPLDHLRKEIATGFNRALQLSDDFHFNDERDQIKELGEFKTKLTKTSASNFGFDEIAEGGSNKRTFVPAVDFQTHHINLDDIHSSDLGHGDGTSEFGINRPTIVRKEVKITSGNGRGGEARIVTHVGGFQRSNFENQGIGHNFRTFSGPEEYFSDHDHKNGRKISGTDRDHDSAAFRKEVRITTINDNTRPFGLTTQDREQGSFRGGYSGSSVSTEWNYDKRGDGGSPNIELGVIGSDDFSTHRRDISSSLVTDGHRRNGFDFEAGGDHDKAPSTFVRESEKHFRGDQSKLLTPHGFDDTESSTMRKKIRVSTSQTEHGTHFVDGFNTNVETPSKDIHRNLYKTGSTEFSQAGFLTGHESINDENINWKSGDSIGSGFSAINKERRDGRQHEFQDHIADGGSSEHEGSSGIHIHATGLSKDAVHSIVDAVNSAVKYTRSETFFNSKGSGSGDEKTLTKGHFDANEDYLESVTTKPINFSGRYDISSSATSY